MMYLFSRINKKNIFCIFLLIFLVSSCGFKRKDPVDIYNKKFLKKYEKTISKKRDKHRKIAAENNIFYGYKKNPDDDLESIKLRDELNQQFLENYRKQDEIDERTKEIEVSYLDENHGEYTKLISVNKPNVDKYSYFNKNTFMKKNFNYINYDTIQTNFDYIVLFSDVRQKNYANKVKEYQELQKSIEEKEKKEKSIFNTDNIKNRFKNLFNKKK